MSIIEVLPFKSQTGCCTVFAVCILFSLYVLGPKLECHVSLLINCSAVILSLNLTLPAMLVNVERVDLVVWLVQLLLDALRGVDRVSEHHL